MHSNDDDKKWRSMQALDFAGVPIIGEPQRLGEGPSHKSQFTPSGTGGVSVGRGMPRCVMSGLRFDVKDRSNVEREALRLAVEDAMGRARAIASGAGGTLGAIVRIEEQGGVMPPRPQRLMMRAEGAAQVQTPVSPGELEITASVTLTVQIR
jgi:hypothetical protein